MLREDDSRVSLREMVRWLVPFTMVVLGLILFFALGRQTRPIAVPVHLEAENP